MELQEIKKLLDKYYNGETTLDEENHLREFFKNSTVPHDLHAEREFFIQLDQEQQDVPENNKLSLKLHQTIDSQVKRENKTRYLNYFYKISSVAAGIAIIAVSYMVVVQNNKKNNVADTYQDPKIAYEQVKKTLMYVSQNMNYGTQSLSQVSKLDKAMTDFSTLASFNSGIKNLELIGKYYNQNELKR
jgi:hypothetical protein